MPLSHLIRLSSWDPAVLFVFIAKPSPGCLSPVVQIWLSTVLVHITCIFGFGFFCRFYLVFLHRTTPWFLQSGSSEGLVSSQVLFFKVTSRDSQDRGAAESSSCRGYIGNLCGPVTGQVGASSGFCVYSLATIPAGKWPSHCRRSEAPMMFSTGLQSSLRTQCPSRTFDTWGSEGLWF